MDDPAPGDRRQYSPGMQADPGKPPPADFPIPSAATALESSGRRVGAAVPARVWHSIASESETSARPATPAPESPEPNCCADSGKLPPAEKNAAFRAKALLHHPLPPPAVRS